MALLKISFDAHSDSPILADLPFVSDVSLVCLFAVRFSPLASHRFLLVVFAVLTVTLPR